MNKDKLVTAGIIQLLKLIVDGKLFQYAFELVQAEFNSDVPGEVKKQRVTTALNDVQTEIGKIVSGMSGWVISILIDAIHAYLKVRS